MRSGDNNHRAEIARLALGVRRRLDFLIQNKDEGAGLEVKVVNGVCETAFKVGNRRESTLQKTFMHGGEIFFMFGELGGTESDEVMGLHAVRDFGSHERGFSDVERKEGLSTMCHVVRRMAC